MSTIFRSRRATEPRSGGKMVRPRRAAGARTPYERPRLANPDPENPNWLSRLIYSPTRTIATGAGKLLTNVFFPESSSSESESSSASSSADDSSSEHNIENDDSDISTRRTNKLIQKKDGSSEMIKHFRKEPQTAVGKSETKCVIEQLLMQETFSREECDRLIMIVKSRVVDCPTTEHAEDGGPDIDTPHLCSTAVMEAKKWLKEKKLTNSKLELDHGTCTSNSLMPLLVTEDQVGSPADMAKSYMRARPPWASPTAKHVELKPPSPIGMQLFAEETPYSIGGNSASSSKLKRESLATGSWNIQEEIRRVRSKATEEMLRTLPSSKIDWSALTLGHKSSPNSLAAEKLEDVSLTQDGPQKEALLHNPAIIISEQNQDLEATRITEGKEVDLGLLDGMEGILSYGERIQSLEVVKTVSPSDTGAGNVDELKDTIVTNELHNSIVGGTLPDSALHEENFLTSKEVAGKASAFAGDVFPSSGSSLIAGLDTEQVPMPVNEEDNCISSSHDKVATGAPLEETCEFLSEASMEVPTNINENDAIANDSQNSSSMRYEELSQDLSQPVSKNDMVDKTSAVVEKQQGNKMSRYNRRGRSRGSRGRGK
ncbi:protein KAKU4 [Quercus suber]|uniref:protein KAKU4 n=1 Tax=Quercus suber TaxID=58331 RepID=UPI000CE225F5|nr:protein KAKU4 [Quercus suber]POE66773.1 protein kaku4 [Quercus suber]